MSSFRADLIVVVADGNMQATLVHPRHDPGCWKDGPEILAIKHQHYRHGLLALDWEGCNSKRPAEETRQDLQERLDRLTTPGCGTVVVLQPELEIWVFSGSTEVDRAPRLAARNADAMVGSARPPSARSGKTGQTQGSG